MISVFKKTVAVAAPVMAGYVAIGIPCGILEAQIGIDPILCFLISISYYSGAGQFMIPTMVMAAAEPLSIIASVSLVNTRQTLYAAALSPYLNKANKLHTFLFSATVTDESFGLNIDKFASSKPWSVSEGLAVNLECMFVWAAANFAGAQIGALLSLPVSITSFAMTSIFICLLMGQRLKGSGAIALVAAGCGVLVCKLVGLGAVSIFIGAVIGVVLGTLWEETL